MPFGSQNILTGGVRTDATYVAPAGIANGNFLVIAGMWGKLGGVVVTPPTNWIEFAGSPLNVMDPPDTFVASLRIYGKLANNEVGNYQFTHDSASTEGVIMRFTGLASSPVSPNPTVNFGTGTTSTALGLTAAPGSDVLYITIAWDGQGGPVPAGATPTFIERLNGGNVYVATGNFAAGGPTGDKSNANGNAVGNEWAAVLAALAPPVVGGAAQGRFHLGAGLGIGLGAGPF
jgi:hypothetical protein